MLNPAIRAASGRQCQGGKGLGVGVPPAEVAGGSGGSPFVYREENEVISAA